MLMNSENLFQVSAHFTESSTNYSGDNHYHKLKSMHSIIAQTDHLWLSRLPKKKDRCPNSVGVAKQTLKIRVEPRGALATKKTENVLFSSAVRYQILE